MRWRTCLLFALGPLLGGCSLAPAYHAPAVSITDDAWKDTPWRTACPADDAPKGQWWRIYHDAQLDRLEEQVERGNPDLAAALARFEQAQAYTGQLRSGLYPGVDSGAGLTDNRQSDNRPLRGANQPNVYDANSAGIGANFNLDLWGRVRSLVATGNAEAQASAADVENVRLGLQAQLAQDYIALRGVDAQAKLLEDTIAAYSQALALTARRHDGGIASGLDVARAETQLRSMRAEAAELASQRALYEHAIASLTGTAAMDFSIPISQQDLAVPGVPVGIPSALLQRRPDVAAAERRAAAANSMIGAARAAFYPDFSLSASYGFQNTGEAGLLTAPNTYWTLGPGMIFNLFDAGRREAKLTESRASFEQASAQYRSIVLAAFQQVQDDLSKLKFDRQGELEQDAAAEAAGVTLQLAGNRYREGAVNYLEVVTAQAAALAAKRNALELHNRQLRNSVDLIRALGGGWSQQEPSTSGAIASKQ
ncbi:MAG: efflux transporter outer membrane subunit [Burkholderiaceae bacterium]|nr:efflux transporter outer membrane subunit [Burkholderiaceae bacterium]